MPADQHAWCRASIRTDSIERIVRMISENGEDEAAVGRPCRPRELPLRIVEIAGQTYRLPAIHRDGKESKVPPVACRITGADVDDRPRVRGEHRVPHRPRRVGNAPDVATLAGDEVDIVGPVIVTGLV